MHENVHTQVPWLAAYVTQVSWLAAYVSKVSWLAAYVTQVPWLAAYVTQCAAKQLATNNLSASGGIHKGDPSAAHYWAAAIL
jgi:hypothetical protein